MFGIFPEIRDEIFAAAGEMNFPAERLASWLMAMGCCYDLRGCTAFAFCEGGKTYFGRSNDLPPFLKKTCCSALYRPTDGGNKFLLNTSAFINGEEGVNEYGLACAMTFVVPRVDEIRPGLNSMFIVRCLLEKADSVLSALKLLKEIPVASACNILLADSSGALAVCECNPAKIKVNNNIDFVYMTNEFQDKEMKSHSAAEHGPYRSEERLATCKNAFCSPIDAPLKFAEDLLAGKFGFLCNYPKGCNFDTVWASIFCLNDGQILRAEGNPTRTAFREDRRARLLFRK